MRLVTYTRLGVPSIGLDLQSGILDIPEAASRFGRVYHVKGKTFPNTMIEVFVEVLQADAGTRCAGITAASLALADAGIPMKDLVASVAAGKIGKEYVLDLEGKEVYRGNADVIVCDGFTGNIIAFMPL